MAIPQHYVIKFVSDLQQSQWFSPVSSTNKTDCYEITEILLKVALDTINLNLFLIIKQHFFFTYQYLLNICNVLTISWLKD